MEYISICIIKMISKAMPDNLSHTRHRKGHSHWDFIKRRAPNSTVFMVPADLSSSHPVCPSRDQQRENSQLSQGL